MDVCVLIVMRRCVTGRIAWKLILILDKVIFLSRMNNFNLYLILTKKTKKLNIENQKNTC